MKISKRKLTRELLESYVGDDHEGCRYFDAEKYEREEKTEDKNVSG